MYPRMHSCVSTISRAQQGCPLLIFSAHWRTPRLARSMQQRRAEMHSWPRLQTMSIPDEFPMRGFRVVPGFPDYAASDDGRIQTRWRQGSPGGLISQYDNGEFVRAHLHRDKSPYALNVGAVVLLAWRGCRPEGMECCHNDGDHTNNNLSNLRWDTHKANMADANRHGTTARGDRHGARLHPERVASGDRHYTRLRPGAQRGENNNSSKLTVDAVRAIRSDTRSHAKIAADYGVAPSAVTLVKQRKTWNHIT